MRGGGGYLLWCHKVIPADEPELIVVEASEKEANDTKVEESAA